MPFSRLSTRQDPIRVFTASSLASSVICGLHPAARVVLRSRSIKSLDQTLLVLCSNVFQVDYGRLSLHSLRPKFPVSLVAVRKIAFEQEPSAIVPSQTFVSIFPSKDM
jgi:hypothetical protein